MTDQQGANNNLPQGGGNPNQGDLRQEFETFKASLEERTKQNDALVERNKELQRNLESCHELLKAHTKVNTVVIKEKKISKLNFADADIDVDNWINDVRKYFESKVLTDAQKCDFIFDNTKGDIKEELRYRGVGKSPEQLLDLINETFSQVTSLAGLQRKFYERAQLQSESIFTYALVLLKHVDKIRKKDGTNRPIGEYNAMLKDRFSEGVLDEELKQGLRKLNMEHPKLDFFEFRDQAVKWLGEKGMQPGSTSSHQESIKADKSKSQGACASPEFASTADLYEIIERQEHELRSLKSGQQVSVDEQHGSSRYSQPPQRNRSYGNSNGNRNQGSHQYGNRNQGSNHYGNRNQGGSNNGYSSSRPQQRSENNGIMDNSGYRNVSNSVYHGKGNGYNGRNGNGSYGNNQNRNGSSRNGNNGGSRNGNNGNRQQYGQRQQGYSQSNGHQRYHGPRYTSKGEVICFKCNGLNHIARDCKLN